MQYSALSAFPASCLFPFAKMSTRNISLLNLLNMSSSNSSAKTWAVSPKQWTSGKNLTVSSSNAKPSANNVYIALLKSTHNSWFHTQFAHNSKSLLLSPTFDFITWNRTLQSNSYEQLPSSLWNVAMKKYLKPAITRSFSHVILSIQRCNPELVFFFFFVDTQMFHITWIGSAMNNNFIKWIWRIFTSWFLHMTASSCAAILNRRNIF